MEIKMPKSPWKPLEILSYGNHFGTQDAIDILLMIGPDRFDGDYDKLMEKLLQKQREEAKA